MTRTLSLLLLVSACKDKASETGTLVSDSAQDSAEPAPSGCTDQANPAPLGANSCVSEAPCQWSGSQSYAYFGYALDAGQDVDGDGREDLIVGAPLEDVAGAKSTLADAGTTTLISGGALDSGTNGTLAVLPGQNAGDYSGTSVALLGDTNGDGLSEILVGARGSDEAGEEAGSAHLYLGSSAGWEGASPHVILTGERAWSKAGTTVAATGDANGDGLADFLINGELRRVDPDSGNESYDAGRVYLLFGRTSTWDTTASLADADVAWSGESAGHAAGLGLARGGDIDGDGYTDPAIGAPYAASYKGRVYVIPGGPELTSSSLAEAPVQIDGEAAYDAFGWSLTTGDLNGDGLAELIVGAPLSDRGWDTGGAVMVYLGAPDFFEGTPVVHTIFNGEFDDHQLGTGLVAHADLTADGHPDLLMGAVSAWRGLVTKGGRMALASGPISDWPAEVDMGAVDIQLHGESVKDYLGRAAASADLDGDGLSDLVVGSGYTNSYGYDSGSIYLFWGE
jgi:hypothetical protein